VVVAADGRRAVERFRAEHPDLVILDLMLPEMSGLDVCRLIRQESTVPIVVVTAKDAEADKVTGLELGADDYVTKPFSVRELVSRVRAHLRRVHMTSTSPIEEQLQGGPVDMDVSRHEVRINGELVAFPPKEFELLETFLRRKGRLLTRDFLIEEVWGHDYFGDTKTLDVHVKRIRRKVEDDPHIPNHLLTVRGLGYKFVD
jgi:two-component system, OmpR family, response regulator RegX3